MKTILYIVYTGLESDTKSGSSVRPYQMYKALKNKYNVILLKGWQNRSIERSIAVFKFLNKIKNNKNIEFCYIEPPSGPLFNFFDYILLMYLKVRNIPTGLFYRDAYHKYASWYSIKGIKKSIIYLMCEFNWILFTYICKIIYFPTESMASLYNFKNKSILPPAGSENLFIDEDTFKYSVIYVGNVDKVSGTHLLLKAMKLVNKTRPVKLNLICRNTIPIIEKYKKYKWLNVYHTSGEDNITIYNKSDCCIIPRLKDFYMDFCMPVKIMEYLSYGIPIITTNCKEIKNFVEINDIGISVEDNPESMADGILKMYNNADDYRKYKLNMRTCLNDSNLWIHRVEQISKDLEN